jgi:hypothetical protein
VVDRRQWLGIGDLTLVECGSVSLTHVRLSSDEPVAALGIGLQWDPATLTVNAIDPGPDVVSADIAAFSAAIEGALGPGLARVDLQMHAGLEIAPGNNLGVLGIEAQGVAAGTPPGSPQQFCFADGVGEAGEDTTVTVVRVAGNEVETPEQRCGVSRVFTDVEPPAIQCPLGSVIRADAACTAIWDEIVIADDTCDADPQVTTGAALPLVLGPGSHSVSYSATDVAGNQSDCETTVVVEDWSAPIGGITAPMPGSCSTATVTVTDDFSDNCDAAPLRTYEPSDGPTYSAHGDYNVTLSVTDASRNFSSDNVTFTIDQVPPAVGVLPLATLDLPSSMPFTDLFTADDDDDAAGDVLMESVYMDGCLIYDGVTYGNGDGLLSDETLLFDHAVACEAIARCALTGMDQVTVRVDVEDCSGNLATDETLLAVIPALNLADCQPRLQLERVDGATEILWTPVFAAQAYDLIRADLGELNVLGDSIDLGSTTCIGEDLTAPMASDATEPLPGEGFGYLLRYTHFATTTPYGWSSSGLPRAPTSGDCSP